ncbi:MAG: 30S ribosomal protein S2 [Nitrospirota bacterium]
MPVITMKEMLEAGVHFGHQAKHWNPKMRRYIFGERNSIYIIDLKKTVKKIEEAYNVVRNLAAEEKFILFVGTKRQAQDIIREEAIRSGMFYVNHRWLGGMLTNFQTIRNSINKLKKLEESKNNGTYDRLPKKEVVNLEKERVKLEKNLAGIKDMTQLPEAIFIVDLKKERIALLEAFILGIPVIAIADTNCDPEGVSYVIPGNDDALRSIKLIVSRISDAVLEGKQLLMQKKEVGKEKAASVDSVDKKDSSEEETIEVVEKEKEKEEPTMAEAESTGGTIQ